MTNKYDGDHCLILTFTLNLDHFRQDDLEDFLKHLRGRIQAARKSIEDGTWTDKQEGKLFVDRPKGH